ncbi:hypothetical protein V6x_41310 [Gimesia chilikensis]|uniref:Uncharacterized protein n=1 Tax=Gimesia chilikensis TaxID=2605989 RepID=A0A517WGN3_9PLAN|nr:hypothetical protein [Gimesia chilikensis]QDU04403.1 hypothetical protein V6x_41310 [Gimesia chilikensis]
MDNEIVIPATYEQWRNLIEGRCHIRLTPTYIRDRLTELQDGTHVKTRDFASLYGDEQLQRTIAWFKRAANELTGEQE